METDLAVLSSHHILNKRKDLEDIDTATCRLLGNLGIHVS